MKQRIILEYEKIVDAIHVNHGRAVLIVTHDGEAILTDKDTTKPHGAVAVAVPREAGTVAGARAMYWLGELNGATAWRGQRIYGQPPDTMFTFTYEYK